MPAMHEALGVQDGDKVAITAGLKPGDTVVVDGADRLRDGADVTIPNPKAAITAPSAGVSSARSGRNAAAQAAMLKTCTPDLTKLCSGMTGRDAMRCLFNQNRQFAVQRIAQPRWPRCVPAALAAVAAVVVAAFRGGGGGLTASFWIDETCGAP